MNNINKPLTSQNSILDQFDLEQEADHRQKPQEKSSPAVPNVVAISSKPAISTPAAISPKSINAIDIPILTTIYSASQALKSASKTEQPAQPVPGAQAS